MQVCIIWIPMDGFALVLYATLCVSNHDPRIPLPAVWMGFDQMPYWIPLVVRCAVLVFLFGLSLSTPFYVYGWSWILLLP